MIIAVVSHDAGSSELLCALIARYSDMAEWKIFALGQSPMAHICERYHLSYSPITDANDQLESLRPDILFFGTGWQNTIELPYLQYCKEHRIPTVAFLDHWSNYRERFGYPRDGWRSNCADYTAVTDPKALQLARSFDLPHPIALPNYYLQELLARSREKEIIPNQNLLFLSEPTDTVAERTYGNPNYWGFTQYTALEEILKHFDQFGCSGLTIRLHPSETSSGYKKILKKFPRIRAQINDAKTFDLTDQLLAAKMVIGFDTMALYIAALLGRNVLSYLPSPNREFLLPLPKTHQVRTLKHLPTSLSLSLEEFGMDFALFLKTVTGKR